MSEQDESEDELDQFYKKPRFAIERVAPKRKTTMVSPEAVALVEHKDIPIEPDCKPTQIMYQNISQQETVETPQASVEPKDPKMDYVFDFDFIGESTQICGDNHYDLLEEFEHEQNEDLPFLNIPRASYKSMLDFRLECYMQWKYRANPLLTFGSKLPSH